MDKEVAVRKSQEVGERVRQFVAELRREVYGEKGFPDWGTLFSQIEELGVQIGDQVCREFVRQSVSKQAEQTPSEEHCPKCGRPVEQQGPEPKTLLTRRGEVGWQEPTGYCKKCRKAFFDLSVSATALRRWTKQSPRGALPILLSLFGKLSG